MDVNLCDKCLEKLIDNVSANEVLLLEFMNKSKMYNAQLSSDALKIASNIKGMTKYKVDLAIKRMEVLGFIDSVKFGSLKYYITKTGRRFITNYRQTIANNLISDKTLYLEENDDEDEEVEVVETPRRGRRKK